MKILSRREIAAKSLEEVADFHGKKLHDFILEVYPRGVFVKDSSVFYEMYLEWCSKQTPLGQLL